MELSKVDNLVSMDWKISKGTEQWSKVNVMCIFQIQFVSEWRMKIVFMGFCKNIIFLRWFLYWWWVSIFPVHFESLWNHIQIKAFTLDHLGAFTWKRNSIYLTKLVWWWMLTFFTKMRYPFTAQYMTLFLIDWWVWLHGIRMWFMFDYREGEIDKHLFKDKVSSRLHRKNPLNCRIVYWKPHVHLGGQGSGRTGIPPRPLQSTPPPPPSLFPLPLRTGNTKSQGARDLACNPPPGSPRNGPILLG